MSGLRRACLYSSPPQQLGFCGPDDKKASHLLLNKIRGRKIDELKLRKVLSQFIGAFQYYQMIAQAHQIKDPFADQVVKAYWLGNRLLDKFKEKIPHHSYHVLMIGSVTGRIKFNDQLRDLCRIGWGKVKDKPIKSGQKKLKITVDYQPVIREKGKFILGPVIKREVDWDKDYIPGLKLGQIVSIHWNQAIEILNENEVDFLRRYTQKTLDIYGKTI
ncbi:MAG: DUF6390 family protein [Patescibacteria group bacterium]